MRQWRVYNDSVVDFGEVPYLGVSAKDNQSLLPENYNGWFPFMRFCFSLGDFGVISGMFEALKQKYPAIKIALPTYEYYNTVVPQLFSPFELGDKVNVKTNYSTIMANNPYIDMYFNKGDFDMVFTDHDRSYLELHLENGINLTCKEEPLVEQILRRFGFTETDLTTIDSTPKLYFTQEEVEKNNTFTYNVIGDRDYGCLLFASRNLRFKGRWEKDYLLFEAAKKFAGMPVFYFAEFDIHTTEWGKYFPEAYNFAEYNLSIREQIYIKRKAKFNISYQAGVTDASNGDGSEMHILCPYPTIRENCVRGANYYYFDGSKKKF
jgi:hypothetical protein